MIRYEDRIATLTGNFSGQPVSCSTRPAGRASGMASRPPATWSYADGLLSASECPSDEVERSLQLITNSHVSFDEPDQGDGRGPGQIGESLSSPEADMIRALDDEQAKHQITLLAGEILGRAERRVFEFSVHVQR